MQNLQTENPVDEFVKTKTPSFIKGDLSRTQIKSHPSLNKIATAGKMGSRLSKAFYEVVVRQPCFEGLGPRQLRRLAESAREIHFEPGQRIFEAGGLADRFYLILEGKAVLESETKGPGTGTIQALGPGDNLGWCWLFPTPYFVFGARAIEPTRTILFPRVWPHPEGEIGQPSGQELTQRIAAVVIQNLRNLEQHLMEQVSTPAH